MRLPVRSLARAVLADHRGLLPQVANREPLRRTPIIGRWVRGPLLARVREHGRGKGVL